MDNGIDNFSSHGRINHIKYRMLNAMRNTQQNIMKQSDIFNWGKYENITNDELAILNTHNQFRVTKR